MSTQNNPLLATWNELYKHLHERPEHWPQGSQSQAASDALYTQLARQVLRYSMLIEWSDVDQIYIVTLPEWERVGALTHTHGATYAEAAQKGQELLMSLLIAAVRDGDRIPTPAGYDAHAYAPGETAERVAAESETLAREIEARQTSGASKPHS